MPTQFKFVNKCDNNWDAMTGNTRERYCTDCQKTVHNLSALTRRQAEKLVTNAETQICGRLQTDPSGQPIFHSPFKRLVQISTLACATLSTAAAAQSEKGSCAVHVHVTYPDGTPTSGVKVSFISPETDIQFSGITSEDGTLKTEIHHGKYTLRVDAPGFTAPIQAIDTRCAFHQVQNFNAQLALPSTMTGLVVIDNRQRSLLHRLLHPKAWF